MKKSVRILLLVLALVLVLLAVAPIPLRIRKSLTGMQGVIGDAETATPCTIEIDGWYHWYLLRADNFTGRFAISSVGETVRDDAQLQSGLTGPWWMLTYLTDDGYQTLGVFLSDGAFDKLLINPKGADGAFADFASGSSYIAAPASTHDEAVALAEALAKGDEMLSRIDW